MKVNAFINNSIRILKLAKKPSKTEFQLIAKITGLGILLLGAIGFVILAIKHVFPLLG